MNSKREPDTGPLIVSAKSIALQSTMLKKEKVEIKDFYQM